jgi:succinoglycan biosynthesis protein ExoM
MRVAVCIATYRRPEGLRRLLRALEAQAFDGVPPDVEVVVVDNDDAGSAREVCAETGAGYRWPLRYVVEPRQGISFARNRAVASAPETADRIAFLDDDETPSPRWMAELLRVGRESQASVVAGPVLSRFEGPVPRWIREGAFFDRPRPATGTLLPYTHTGNVMVDARVFREVMPHFDERLALTGGEDTEFFLRVARAGHRIAWADGAEVEEWVPGSRARTGWLVRRAYRKGTVWTYCERSVNPSFGTGLARLAKGSGRLLLGGLTLPVAALRGRAAVVAALEQIARGAGGLAGLAGVRYGEYRTTHGR